MVVEPGPAISADKQPETAWIPALVLMGKAVGYSGIGVECPRVSQ